MNPPDFRNPRAVKEWARRLRRSDHQIQRDEDFRQSLRGSLATGGKGGLADGVPRVPDVAPDDHFPLLEEP